MYKEKWRNYYFPTKPLSNWDKWTLIRKVDQDFLSSKALLRLKWIISYYTVFEENIALESFNGILQREWLTLSRVGLDDIQEANQDLTTWLIKYNSYRPHGALANLTPLEYAHQNFFQVLPM